LVANRPEGIYGDLDGTLRPTELTDSEKLIEKEKETTVRERKLFEGTSLQCAPGQVNGGVEKLVSHCENQSMPVRSWKRNLRKGEIPSGKSSSGESDVERRKNTNTSNLCSAQSGEGKSRGLLGGKVVSPQRPARQ